MNEKQELERNKLQRLVAYLINKLTRTEYHGIEYLPKKGGLIVATNHISRLDIPVLFVNPARADITALVADKYLKNPFIRWFALKAGGIWLDRTKADFTAFSQALATLQSGRALGIAPEGTRSKTRQLLEGKPGTVLLAHRGRVPIVPVGITGTETTLAKIFTFRSARIVARFGPPIYLPPFSRENRDEDLQQQTEEIMCQIAALLPPEYRGFYADHPRLKEILAERGE
jgi:1-acyl-sn-glycerol-3-phosphate acyltransferase